MNKYRSILDFGQMNNNINSKIISVYNTENKTSTPDNNNKTPSIHKKNDDKLTTLFVEGCELFPSKKSK